MKKLFVMLGAVVLVAGATAVAIADDDTSTGALVAPAQLASTDEAPVDEAPGDEDVDRFRHPVLEDVLERLVDAGVIEADQAQAIRDAFSDELAERERCGCSHFRFRFPPGELGEAFTPEQREELERAMEELRDSFQNFDGSLYGDMLRDALSDGELTDEELDGLFEALREMVGDLDLTPFSELSPELEERLDDLSRRLWRRGFGPGDVLPDVLDDGILSDEELDDLERELREMLEHFEGRFPGFGDFDGFHFEFHTEDAASA